MLKLPYIPHTLEKAKLKCLSTITSSLDPAVSELQNCADIVRNSLSVPNTCLEVFTSIVESVSKDTPHYSRHINRSCRFELTERHQNLWNSHLNSLQVQSKFCDIVKLEQDNHVWNRIITGLPSGQLSFILRAGSDCLPTPLNLKRWNYQVSASCPLCSNRSPTTKHILSVCPTALEQGQFTWRHDSILNHLLMFIDKHLTPDHKMYADLPNRLANTSQPTTIPVNISTCSDRPDLVIISPTNAISILELTVPHNSLDNISSARCRKLQKYAHLISDLEHRNQSVLLVSLEIGSLGHFTHDAIRSLQKLLPSLSKRRTKDLLFSLAKISISCSSFIFNSRNFQSSDLYTLSLAN